MSNHLLAVVLTLLLVGCAGQLGPAAPTSEDGGVPTADSFGSHHAEGGPKADSVIAPPPAVDCATRPDFASCGTDSVAAGICLGGACVALPPCAPSGCKPGPNFPLPDTNVRACHDASGAIACPGSAGGPTCASTAYCGQDAQLGWDTKHAGVVRFSVATDGGQRVVSDTITGLVWQGCSAGQSGEACQGKASEMSWHAAKALCEQSSSGGHTDWRLPDAFELQSIADYSRTKPAIDLSVFVNSPSNADAESDAWWRECYWSATSTRC